MPAKRKAGTTQDRAKRRRIRCGAPRWAAHLSAITHIGCVYADEASIEGEYDLGMTRLKRAESRERTLAAGAGLAKHVSANPGPGLRNMDKKKPAV